MPDVRPKSDLLSRVALGLSVLALLPGVLPHYGVEQRTIMALMPGVGAIVLLLFLDVILSALRKLVYTLRAIPARLRAHRRSRIRFTPEWHRVQADRRRL